MAKLIITIDGPAASGKSTVSKIVAKSLDATFLDTGAMYRTVTLAALQDGANLEDPNALIEVIEKHCFDFRAEANLMRASIDGNEVTDRIRSEEVTANAKYIAGTPDIRETLVQMQRDFAENEKRIVTEGRDQGTVAFPNAQVKIFLTADLEERARRRQAEVSGDTKDTDATQAAIAARDKSDENRNVAPLKPADDAITVDTTQLTIEQVAAKILYHVRKKSS